MTDSDAAGCGEEESPTTASGPEVPPALGSATLSSSPRVLRAFEASVFSAVAVLVTAAGRELAWFGHHSQVTPAARTVATVDAGPSDVAAPLPSGPRVR